MKARNHCIARRMALGVVLALATVVGLQGCSRGGWHSPERMEDKFQWIEEELAEELEIRPEQKADYQALSESFKSLARERIARTKDTALRVNGELEKENGDADVVVELIKFHIRERPSVEELEALVDQSAAFYKSLDQDQQRKFREMAGKHIRRHL